MKTIWKWTLQPETTIDMPHGAKLLAVQEQRGEPHLWALVDPGAETDKLQPGERTMMVKLICIAVIISASCWSAGYAVAKVASAALGAASERPELLGRSLAFVGLAEGIAIYGLLVAVLLLFL